MDTITHGIVGALAGKAFFGGRDVPAAAAQGAPAQAESSPTARAAIVAFTLGAIFPDIDTFAGPLMHNPLALMEWHRNITHSLVMLPLWALLLAGVSVPLARWAGWQRPSFAKLALIYALGLGSHVFLDLVTNFGTMIWSPLDYSRPAWDWIFIVDFTFTGIALVPQLAAWCYREPGKLGRRAGLVWGALTIGAGAVYAIGRAVGYGFPLWVAAAASALMAAIIFAPAAGANAPGNAGTKTPAGIGFRWRRASWCRVGFAGLCIYLAGTWAAHRKALAYTGEYAAANHLQVENLAALPLPPTLTHWEGVISTPEGIWRTTFHVPGGQEESRTFYAETLSDPHIQEAKQLRDVGIYLWFARFPLWRVEQHGGETEVDVSDVRFFRDAGTTESIEPPQRGRPAAPSANAGGFTFEVLFGAQGNVVFQGLKPPEY